MKNPPVLNRIQLLAAGVALGATPVAAFLAGGMRWWSVFIVCLVIEALVAVFVWNSEKRFNATVSQER